MNTNYFANRRMVILAGTFAPLITALPVYAQTAPEDIGTYSTETALSELAQLEKSLGGVLGVFAFNSANSTQLASQADVRFPVCSTFKVILASAILSLSSRMTDLLQQRIFYKKSELVNYSPVSEKHISDGMTVAELCAAAIQFSDNSSANLLMKILGGPSAVTAFARSIGDKEFRLDRWETELNTALPGDLRDTSTPRAMGNSLQRLLLGDALSVGQRKQLKGWLMGNTTGATRIRAGIPADWQVGDKTGTGDFGTAHDLGVIWPPGREPVVLAIYTRLHEKDAKARSDVIASAAQIISKWI
ncbi:class A beta-lactamase [Undibacterium sp. Ji67W]|uniref:class A beta-lactamase n=1 Tax=Undibacterium sp. Ji67W TaxID=3413042 RepID=UPI003BEF5404